MDSLKEMLFKEQKHLESIVSKLKTEIIDIPKGNLRISMDNDRVRYYRCREDAKKGDRNGVYIPQAEKAIAEQLAQNTYNEKVLQCAQRRLNQIRKIVRDYEDNEIERIFLSMHSERQKLIKPIEPVWEQRLAEWIEKEYEGKGFREADPIIYSEKGERVRSKSEKILADYFYHNGIPYKYEKPLQLKNYGTIYPDFTFLSRKLGKEIYWEHEGRMDDSGYAKTAIKKIQSYEENEIYVGERLILTFETETTLLNTKDIERNVKRFL